MIIGLAAVCGLTGCETSVSFHSRTAPGTSQPAMASAPASTPTVPLVLPTSTPTISPSPPSSPKASSPPSPSKVLAAIKPGDVPVRIIIPLVHISEPIKALPIEQGKDCGIGAPNGCIIPPDGYVGYVDGLGDVLPGQVGYAEIDGHDEDNGPSVFWNLKDIKTLVEKEKQTIDIQVVYKSGMIATFAVYGYYSELKFPDRKHPTTPNTEQDPLLQASSYTSTAELAVVTCDKDSPVYTDPDGSTHHTENFVVHARRIQ